MKIVGPLWLLSTADEANELLQCTYTDCSNRQGEGMVKSLSVLVNFLVYITVFENWAFSRYFFWLGQNFCLHDTSLGSSTCTLHMLLTTLMELPHIDECRDEILRAAKIKILAPQKLAKDCLSDVGFSPFLTKHKAMLVRF